MFLQSSASLKRDYQDLPVAHLGESRSGRMMWVSMIRRKVRKATSLSKN